jgi:hypothetical protein
MSRPDRVGYANRASSGEISSFFRTNTPSAPVATPQLIRRAGFGPTNLADVISEMLRSGGFSVNDISVEANEWRDLKFAGPTAYELLAAAIREVLAYAIREGGTTLRDHVQSDGSPGYFAVKLNVYERDGKPCRRCGTPIRHAVVGQRSTYYCPACQR